jgi:hypothetical protein
VTKGRWGLEAKEEDTSRIVNLLGTYKQKCVLGGSKTSGYLHHKIGGRGSYVKLEKRWPTDNWPF